MVDSDDVYVGNKFYISITNYSLQKKSLRVFYQFPDLWCPSACLCCYDGASPQSGLGSVRTGDWSISADFGRLPESFRTQDFGMSRLGDWVRLGLD